MSYMTINDILKALADQSIEDACCVAKDPDASTYNNVNFSSSIYVKQTPSAMSKVQSGTFGVIYKLVNVQQEDMEIVPMMKNLKDSSPLSMSDLCPSCTLMQSYSTQNTINITKVLITYVKGFAHYRNLKELQNIPWHQLPPDHKTQFYPLQASMIEEASITGNLLVHDDIYLVQLDCSPEDLDKYAIPAFNDQLTNAWIHGGQAM